MHRFTCSGPLLATLCLMLAWAGQARGDELKPLLGQKGDCLLDESFDAGAVPPGFNVNTGRLVVVDGVLCASQQAVDNHVGAFRYRLPLTDCAVQVDFRFDGARAFHLGYDPAPGQLKKKGHLFSLIVAADSWNITEHNDKNDPNSKGVVLARGAAAFEPGKWYTLLLECKGTDVVAQVAGMEPLRASSRDFGVAKPGLVFRMAGPDDGCIQFDQLRVWQLR